MSLADRHVSHDMLQSGLPGRFLQGEHHLPLPLVSVGQGVSQEMPQVRPVAVALRAVNDGNAATADVVIGKAWVSYRANKQSAMAAAQSSP